MTNCCFLKRRLSLATNRTQFSSTESDALHQLSIGRSGRPFVTNCKPPINSKNDYSSLLFLGFSLASTSLRSSNIRIHINSTAGTLKRFSIHLQIFFLRYTRNFPISLWFKAIIFFFFAEQLRLAGFLENNFKKWFSYDKKFRGRKNWNSSWKKAYSWDYCPNISPGWRKFFNIFLWDKPLNWN